MSNLTTVKTLGIGRHVLAAETDLSVQMDMSFVLHEATIGCSVSAAERDD